MKNLLMLLLMALLVVPIMPAQAQDDDLNALKQEVIQTYADIVYANYADSHALALELQAAIEAFVADPADETLQAAKDAWLVAREPYGQTEAFRFYGGPIDDADGPEGLLNAWPLDEVYIDYVEGMPEAGIINDLATYPEITAELIESLNEQGAEENISVGFHAIEFLLWGQDLSADSAGQRPVSDYTTAPNAERRAQYLTIATDLLVNHLTEMVEAWAPDMEDNYRAEFLALEPDTALAHILTGIGVLSKSELAGERIFTAYDNQDQEDEHSCFSDNTHRDIINNAQGIANVYRGTYTRVDSTVVSGAGLTDLMAAVDPALNETVLAQLDLTLELVNSIHVPFDQAIVLPESRSQIVEVVFGLQDQGDMFVEVAISLGLTIDTALPE
ncbi:MAG: iron-regulated protein [Anaerolineales bacterium]|nr:iron-regulated protein [Anaerolineales bacterium]